MKCASCGAVLTRDETGLSRKLISRAATECFCLDCLGKRFRVSREQLLEEVWGYEYYGDIRTVDVTIRRLREKVEDDPSEPKYIRTKRGIGYYFRRP